MINCEELESELENLKRNSGNEIDVPPLEKWMRKKLNVERLRNKSGGSIRYYHKAIAELKGDGNFTVHRCHKGKREYIYRDNFKVFLYPRLKDIIDYMRKEGLCE